MLLFFFLQQQKFREKYKKNPLVMDRVLPPINHFASSSSSFSDEKEENFESYGENEDVEYEP